MNRCRLCNGGAAIRVPQNHNSRLDAACVHRRLYRIHVRQTAEGEDPFVIYARDRRPDRFSTWAQNQGIIGLFVLSILGLIVHHDGLGLAIDADDFAAGADIDGKTLTHRLRILDQKACAILDDPAHVIGKTTVGEGDVFAPLKENDLGVFAHASGLGCGRCPTCHSTHNHNASMLTHTCSLFDSRQGSRTSKCHEHPHFYSYRQSLM
jgi:hypothetical protein